MQDLATDTFREQLWNRRFDPNIAEVNELCDSLKESKPGSEVLYVDPAHSTDECRIISLFSNTRTHAETGFVTAGDQEASTRMLGMQWQLGLRPEYIIPWNVYPWIEPGEPLTKLTPAHVADGLKPLLRLLAIATRASALVAHGNEAHRLADQLMKAAPQSVHRRGFKTFKVRSLGGRSFAGTPERQQEYLDAIHAAYAEAMARTGLQRR
ncbi:uracil-DNA glycosylase [Arthrobacter sp. M4]|uniref:uracil-DNA glycosylase n=1 Tax=Arthrobacter sp. M4 TaxID=218160 RepID=UPI001CDBD350|nr:uracil-DNA glycosylase [Arthrobacter sp. M4]MCA4134296.1 uracil-DNA glycosylase [Arthrobacter sp. M4]